MKSQQLQIRVSPLEKRFIKAAAKAAGCDISAWVLQRVLQRDTEKFLGLIRDLAITRNSSASLASISDYLNALKADHLSNLPGTGIDKLEPLLANYVAAMIEQVASREQAFPPSWVHGVPPLKEPWFASNLESLRLHLLTASPPPFRRRNIYIDSTVGDRV